MGLAAAGAAISPAVAAQELTDKLTGMTPEERDAYLKSEEFQQWVRQSQANADAAKGVLDGLVDSGAMAPLDAGEQANGYGQFLQQYWAESAMREAGIDPNHWDPSKGVDYNRADIYKVYAFYAELYKNDPRMEWIGMANQVGPTFIAGFEDLAVLRKAAAAGQDMSDSWTARIPRNEAGYTAWPPWASPTCLLRGNFPFHAEGDLLGHRVAALRLPAGRHGRDPADGGRRRGDPAHEDAWTSLDSVPAYSGPEGYHQLTPAQQTALHQASYNMADQEQNYVIADDYDEYSGPHQRRSLYRGHDSHG